MISKSEEAFRENFKVSNKVPLFPLSMAILFILTYAFSFVFTLNIDEPYIVSGFWGVFIIISYYVGVYFEDIKQYSIGAFFDLIGIAHSYYLVCYLFDVESYYYVNLLFIVVSFFRAMFINQSSHLPQFFFFLVFGINHYIINAQTQIPLSDLTFVNVLFCLISIISIYIMSYSNEIKKPTISNFNLLLSIYIVIISTALTVEVFDGKILNYGLCIVTLLSFTFYKIFNSKSYFITFLIGSVLLITHQILEINFKSLLSFEFFNNQSTDKVLPTPEVIQEIIPEVTPELVDESFKFSFSDVHYMVYLSPFIVVLFFVIIKIVYNFMEKRSALKEKERIEKEKSLEAKVKEKVVVEAPINVIKEPVEVTGYYDPEAEEEILRLAKIREEARRKAQEEKDFMNPFSLLNDDKDKDDDMFL